METNLNPSELSGTDQGSVYEVVGRTRDYLVGLRRLSKDIYRVRFVREDGKSLNLKGTKPDDWSEIGFKVGDQWIYMSKVVIGSREVSMMIGRLLSAALISEEVVESFISCETPDGIIIQAEFDKAKNAVGDALKEVFENTESNTEPDNKMN